MVDCLADLDKVTDLDPADIDTAEHELTTAAGQLGPEDLRRCAPRMADVLDPDGTLRDEVVAHRRRNLTLRHQRDGRYRLEGELTAEVGAGLFAILSPLARPRPTTLDGSDERDYPQRMHDALGDLASRVLRSGGLPDSGGTPATVILHLDLADLLRRAGTAETSDGALIPTATALKLADEAEIVPIVLSPTGQQLFLGRTRRIATHTQTLALIARDGGCSFPNCTHPADWCERHHIVSWADGGHTDLNNLTLLCGYHHDQHLKRGWTCQLTNGLPAWIPPPWIDPEQKPIIHHRIRQRHNLEKP